MQSRVPVDLWGQELVVLLIYSFDKHLLRAYNAPGPVLGSGGAMVSKPRYSPCPLGVYGSEEEQDTEEIITSLWMIQKGEIHHWWCSREVWYWGYRKPSPMSKEKLWQECVQKVIFKPRLKVVFFKPWAWPISGSWNQISSCDLNYFFSKTE